MVTFVPVFYFILSCRILFGNNVAYANSIDPPGLTLLSSNKTTSQSSTDFPSSNAVDNDYTCSKTKEELNPWWQVDLEKVYTIKQVSIYGGTIHYLIGIRVEISEVESFETGHFHVVVQNQQRAVGLFEIDLLYGRGRFVRIAKYQNSFLKLCEIRVFGTD